MCNVYNMFCLITIIIIILFVCLFVCLFVWFLEILLQNVYADKPGLYFKFMFILLNVY